MYQKSIKTEGIFCKHFRVGQHGSIFNIKNHTASWKFQRASQF